jgi:two-component system C4-dicarboxylate transport sensor histidine kinase DctB
MIITRLNSLARSRDNNRVVVELRSVIENVLEMLEGNELRKATTIELNFEAQKNEVLADPIQLEQVVLNLFTNALDALIDSAHRTIWIDCYQRPEDIEIRLRDNGPGIDPSLRDKILEPFFTTKRVGQGLGLGLSISYNIIKDFGGKLMVETGQETGACFCIRLPKYRGDKQ